MWPTSQRPVAAGQTGRWAAALGRSTLDVVGNDPTALIVAVLVVLLLALILRWVFKPSRPHPISRPVDAADSSSLGLLSVVASGLSRQDAMTQRAVLGEAGIRSSMSKRRDGQLDVLVFHADVDAARLLLGR